MTNYCAYVKDLQIYTAIVAGDPAGLAAAYDRYAARLYAYCRSILPEPADATDAVQETYLIAAVELRRLRDPAKLRPWLYAVARRECLRRLRTRILTTSLDEIADVTADNASTDPAAQAERADLRALVRRAIDGLNAQDRDVIELSLVHELEGNDLVLALGVPRNHAHALLSRARSQLEKSLGALIVAQGGRRACPEVEAMLDGWDGRLTVLLRKRINRHVDRCNTCGELRHRELKPALLTGLVPLPAVLPGLRDQLIRVMASHSTAAVAHRLAVANRAGPFGSSGFPRTMSPPGRLWRAAPRHPRSLAAGVAALLIVAGSAVIVGSGGGTPRPPRAAGSAPGAVAIQPSARPVSGETSPAPMERAISGSGSGTRGSSGAMGPPGTPDPSSTPGLRDAVAFARTSSAPVGTPAAAATLAPGQGTLIVGPGLDLVTLHGTRIGTIILTAVGGPVSHYTVTPSSALAGGLIVSPSSGSLAAGTSVTVTVTSDRLLTVAARLTVNPGDHTVTVLLSL